MDPDTDVCQTEQPQISYSVDFIAEQSSAMGSPNLLDREVHFYSVFWGALPMPTAMIPLPLGSASFSSR